MAFRFKQFSVDDSACAMKVGTDSVLLGSWASLDDATAILDIGTGSGLLALMAAQRSSATITAIDIDAQACHQATANFLNSPWSGRIICHNTGLENFRIGNKHFDHIITNPPFFINSLKSPEKDRNTARHTDSLPAETLMKQSASMLAPAGKLSLIFPLQDKQNIINLSIDNSLHLSRYTEIIPKQGKEPNRVLMEFSRYQVNEVMSSTIVIRDANSRYTPEYISLTEPFYLFLK